MRVIDKKLLKQFSQPGRCECCGRMCGSRDPHHLFSRGAGRIDVRQNLVSICRECHSMVHSGAMCRKAMLEIAAKREGTTPDEIEALVYRLRADDKVKTWKVS